MKASLDHVALTVSDREASAGFYSRFFGLSERVHDDAHLLILAGEGAGILAMSEGDVPPQPPRTTHFGFQLESADAVHQLRQRFASEGIEEAEWQESGPVRVQVFDPDGYRVEAYAWT